jgi:hypothetical protein
MVVIHTEVSGDGNVKHQRDRVWNFWELTGKATK